jgi:TonB family protein
MGKTTLLFNLLEHLQTWARTAFIFHTQCDSREFMRYLCSEFDCEVGQQDSVHCTQELKRLLLREAKAGRRVILLIDEAQNLEESVLETIRLLTDFETPQTKLLQIVLAGQPQLAATLARPTMTQLRQRISLISHLEPFTPEETALYIEHRLRVAGLKEPTIFSAQATRLIAEYSGGVPRIINNICFSALSIGYALGRKVISTRLIEEVRADLESDGAQEPLGCGSRFASDDPLEPDLEDEPALPVFDPGEFLTSPPASSKNDTGSQTTLAEKAKTPSGNSSISSARSKEARPVFQDSPLAETVKGQARHAHGYRRAALSLGAATILASAALLSQFGTAPLTRSGTVLLTHLDSAWQEVRNGALLSLPETSTPSPKGVPSPAAGQDRAQSVARSQTSEGSLPSANSPAMDDPASTVSDDPEDEEENTTSPETPAVQPAATARRKHAIAVPRRSIRRIRDGKASGFDTSAEVAAPPAIANSEGMLAAAKTLPPPTTYVTLAARDESPQAQKGAVVAPQLIKQYRPPYPWRALAAHVEGTVSLVAVLDATGRVTDVQPIAGNSLLIPAASQAVRGWQYRPAYADGKPVASQIDVQVTFNLQHP